MLGIENRASMHACAQHCCTDLAKRLHHATSAMREMIKRRINKAKVDLWQVYKVLDGH